MKEHIKTYLIVIGIILIAVIALVKARDYFSNNNSNNKITGSVIGTEQKTISTQQKSNTPTGANVRRATQNPTSCTPQQNCGSPTCGVASGRGSSCGCGR